MDITGEIGTTYLGVPRSATISDVVCDSEWKIRSRGQRRFPELYAILAARPVPCQHAGADVVLWRADDDEFKPQFTSAKTWNFSHDKKSVVSWRKITWFK